MMEMEISNSSSLDWQIGGFVILETTSGMAINQFIMLEVVDSGGY